MEVKGRTTERNWQRHKWQNNQFLVSSLVASFAEPGTVLGILLIHLLSVEGHWWCNSKCSGPRPGLTKPGTSPVTWGSVDWLRSLGKHAALQWASPEQGVGNDLEQRENQASTLIMHSMLVKWNSLSLLSLEMLQCTSYLLFHIPRDTSILTVTCKMFKNKGCNVVSGERKMIFLSLIRTVLGQYVIYMKIWPKGPERMPPSLSIS